MAVEAMLQHAAGAVVLSGAAGEQLERFFLTLARFLQSSGGLGSPVLLSRIASSGPVQSEWVMLQRASIVSKSVKMKQVILQRPQFFRIVSDHRNQPHVVLIATLATLPVAGFSAAGAPAGSKAEASGEQGVANGTRPLSVVKQLEMSLASLTPSWTSVRDVMVFCIDHAQQAAVLTRRLTACLAEQGLTTSMALARLYVICDVLSNASCQKQGVGQYRTSFQDLLPDACEQMGRLWFSRIADQSERGHAERQVRAVLKAWQELDAFPPLFALGLECLFFKPILDAEVAAALETEERLRQRLQRWFLAADQARLPYACRLRGLAGRALPTAQCRARLCHFERYWRGVDLPEVDQEWAREVNAGGGGQVDGEDETDSIDGEAVTEVEFAAALQEACAAEAACGPACAPLPLLSPLG